VCTRPVPLPHLSLSPHSRVAATGSGGVEPSVPRAIAVLGIGCETGNADACSEAARLLLKEYLLLSPQKQPSSSSSSTPPPSSPAPAPSLAPVRAAQAHLERCCAAGESVSHAKCCGTLGALYLSPRFGAAPPSGDPADAVRCLERACRGEQASACMRLAALHRGGRPDLGVAADPAAAAAFDRQGLVWAGMSERQAEAAVTRRRQAQAVAAAAAAAEPQQHR
jgi:TPR repeat protein